MDEKSFYSGVLTVFDKHINVGEISPLNLAYIGDGVFELCVRTLVINKPNTSVNNLHKSSRAMVNAGSQAKMYFAVLDYLDEEELAVIKRGRNARSQTTAKNASVVDYRHATGLEALFGYLYLKGRNDRVLELFRICVEEISNEERK